MIVAGRKAIETIMKRFTYKIKDEIGMHARPAGLLAKKAAEFKSNITIELNSKKADAKRLFALMGLNAVHNDTITITILGEDEEEAENALKIFLSKNL